MSCHTCGSTPCICKLSPKGFTLHRLHKKDNRIKELKAENAALKANNHAYKALSDLHRSELLAAQHRIKELREALTEMSSPIRQSDEAKAREYDLLVVAKALSTPDNIEALDALVRDAERGQKLQKIAEGIEYRQGLRGFFVPEDIRDLLAAMKETKK